MTTALTVLFNLVLAVLLLGHVRGALRSGAAVGLFWDFLREREPMRYWIHVAVILIWALLAITDAMAELRSAG